MLGFARGRESYAKASTPTPFGIPGEDTETVGSKAADRRQHAAFGHQLKQGPRTPPCARSMYTSAPLAARPLRHKEAAMIRMVIWLAIDTAQALLDAVKIVAADR